MIIIKYLSIVCIFLSPTSNIKTILWRRYNIYMPITRYDDPVKLRYNMMLLLSWLYPALIGLRRWIVYSRCPATEINCAQFGVKSQFADLPAVYTSSLPYLTHICEDFLLLERESKFIFMLFIRNYTWGYQVISGGVGWKRELTSSHVVSAVFLVLHARVFVLINNLKAVWACVFSGRILLT